MISESTRSFRVYNITFCRKKKELKPKQSQTIPRQCSQKRVKSCWAIRTKKRSSRRRVKAVAKVVLTTSSRRSAAVKTRRKRIPPSLWLRSSMKAFTRSMRPLVTTFWRTWNLYLFRETERSLPTDHLWYKKSSRDPALQLMVMFYQISWL